jgi:ThiF family
MSKRQLVFPYALWQRCHSALFSQNGCEGFAMGLARPCKRGQGIAYVVEQLLDQGSYDYLDRSSCGVTLNDTASSQLNLLSLAAAKAGLVPVHLHSHPKGATNFSAYDDIHELELHEWLEKHGQPFLWSVVWPYAGEPKARLWVNSMHLPGIVRAGLQPFGSGTSNHLPALERQRLFGPSLRHATAILRVGIVGVGGIGFLVAEQLARTGFCDFVLIDPDYVEDTNLNRLQGTTRSDTGALKVKVARRLILQAGRSIGTHPTVHALAQDIYIAPARVRSLLRQCDIVLALTDDELSRITCLQIALEGGAEYLQAGVDIRLNDQGAITGLFAEVTGAEVNRYCPLCTGRLDAGQASVDARRYVGGEVWDRAKKDGYVPDVAAPSVMSLNAIASGLLVMEIQRRVSGLGVRDLMQIDVQGGTVKAFEHIEDRLKGTCEVCGRGE